MGKQSVCENCGHKLGHYAPMDILRRVRVLISGLGADKHYDVWLCQKCVAKVEDLLGPPAEWVDQSPMGLHDMKVQVFAPDGAEMEVQEVYTRYGFGSVPPQVRLVVGNVMKGATNDQPTEPI
jgi:hypothetical protein